MKNLNNVHNLTGQKFGKLTVIDIDDRGTRKTYWNCRCDCGNMKSVRSDSLLAGAIRSCGCLKKEQDKINLTANHSHKQSNTRLYNIWRNMKARCYNPNSQEYYRYGGRDICVCDEWLNNFATFYEWAVNHGYSEKLTIDRIDNNGNYEPNNCRWADAKQQANNRRSNINITIGNATKTLIEWCEIFGLHYHTIKKRYAKNKSISIDELFKK